MPSRSAPPCDVCLGPGATDAPSNAPRARTRRVTVAARVLHLCGEHAAVVAAARPTSWDALRALFVPPGERRSRLARRLGEERRVFARPEGRRRGAGRRASDRAA